MSGKQEVVKVLLAKYAKEFIDAKNNQGITPLHWAAGYGDNKRHVERRLLEAGVYQDVYKFCRVVGGDDHKEIVELLLKEGAKIDEKDVRSRTPLQWAAYNGHTEAVEKLLSRGAQVDIKNDIGETPLHLAAESGHIKIVKLLMEKVGVEEKDNYGRTPLYLAAIYGHTEIIEELLKVGAEVDAEDKDGQTPLSKVASVGHKEMVKYLCSKGAKKENSRSLLNNSERIEFLKYGWL